MSLLDTGGADHFSVIVECSHRMCKNENALQVLASTKVAVLDCNCSVCKMKGNKHFVVPAKNFKLLKGRDHLTLYQFNTMKAQHFFCKLCGVQSFYVPRSNPDGYAVTMACIDPGTLEDIDIVPCDGENWEQFMSAEGSKINDMSKPAA